MTMSSAQIIAFDNFVPPVAPTGVNFNMKPYFWMLAIGTLMLTGMIYTEGCRRRRKREEED